MGPGEDAREAYIGTLRAERAALVGVLEWLQRALQAWEAGCRCAGAPRLPREGPVTEAALRAYVEALETWSRREASG
jgi:hypothetical protein